MSVDVMWANETRNAVLIRFSDTCDEVRYVGVREVLALFNSVTVDVHLIIDVSESQNLPPGLLSALRRTRRELRCNKGETIIVGMRPLIRTILHLLHNLSMFRWQALLVDDLESALKVVEQARSVAASQQVSMLRR